jgi:pimeloyl-ACP methyl ester carboxylesterase
VAKIRVGSGDIAYDEAGSGLPVILVHAGLADRRMWEHQFWSLAASHRVIRYDWRGRGQSDDVTDGEVSHHEDLLALMDALDLDQAILVGASMGGGYALNAALTAPERIRGLALICAGLTGYAWRQATVEQFQQSVSPALAARCQRYADRSAARVDPADIEAMAEANVRLMVVGPDRERADFDPLVLQEALNMCQGVFARDWSGPTFQERQPEPSPLDRLDEITVPALVVSGRYDLGGVQEIADLLTEGIKGAERIDLDTGHLPSIEQPSEVSAALVRFLEEL